MKRSPICLSFFSLFLLLCWPIKIEAQAASTSSANKSLAGSTDPVPRPCVACIRAHMEFLASDALRGRGSGTTDELVAATYIASQLRAYGITPAGDDGGYLQRATLLQPKFTAPPQLSFAKSGANTEKVTFSYGKDFTVAYLSQVQFSGRLRVINADEKGPQVAGTIV